jgi:hypothetical protein
MGNLCARISNRNSNIFLHRDDDKFIKFKKEILSASKENLCLCFQMNNGRQYVGKPQLYYKYSNLQDITSVEVMLFRDIPLWYHVGGEKLQIYIKEIKNIIVMNEQEIEDSKKYTNNALLFVQRLFPDS